MFRVVIDTNILISAVIRPLGTVGLVLRHLRDGHYKLLYSEPILTEIVDVLNRPTIRNKYGVTQADIETIVGLVLLRGEVIIPKRRITICRDPKDNMILEAAADGFADMIISGDQDLLSIGDFEGIAILTPAEFISHLD